MNLKSILLTGAGLLLLALGAVGLFLPVLPTTPFVLASATCLTCNPALRGRVLKIPFFKEYIDNHYSRNGLPRKTVIRSLLFLWSALAISALWVGSAWMAVLLAAIGAAVTAHILHIARPRSGQFKK